MKDFQWNELELAVKHLKEHGGIIVPWYIRDALAELDMIDVETYLKEIDMDFIQWEEKTPDCVAQDIPDDFFRPMSELGQVEVDDDILDFWGGDDHENK